MVLNRFCLTWIKSFLCLFLLSGPNHILGSEQKADQALKSSERLELQFYQVESRSFGQNSHSCFQVKNTDLINWEDQANLQNTVIDFTNPDKELLEKHWMKPWSKSIIPYETQLTHNITGYKILLISVAAMVEVIPSHLRGELIFRYDHSSNTFEYPDFRGKICTELENNDAFPFAVMLGKGQELHTSNDQSFDKELLFNNYILGNWPFNRKGPYDFTRTNLFRLVDDQSTEYVVVEWMGHPCSTQWLLYRIGKNKAEFMQTNGGGC